MALSKAERQRLLSGLRSFQVFAGSGRLSHVLDAYPQLYWVQDPPRGISVTEHKLSLMDPLVACASALLPYEYEVVGDASGGKPRKTPRELHQPINILMANQYTISDRFETLPHFVRSVLSVTVGTMSVRGRVLGLWDLVQDSLVPNDRLYLVKYFPHGSVLAVATLLFRATAESLRTEFSLGNIHISPFGIIDHLIERAETERAVRASVVDTAAAWRSTLAHWVQRITG